MARGRPVGSGSKVTEVCPEHPGSRVVRCGTYGRAGERRQRFLCEPADGSPKHRFAGPAPRLVAAAGVCFACGNPIAPHEGPRAPGRYRFPVVEAAEALVMVGQGVSYTEAANRVRQRLDRAQMPSGAQLVANWVETLGPVVAADAAETGWPETVVCDHTWFMVTNRRAGTTYRAFCVLGVYGYDEAGPGRLWALKAATDATAATWRSLLLSLPGAPKVVVSDGDRAIAPAVAKVWPEAFHKLCEHHLREGARKQMEPYGLTGFGHPSMELLNDAFRTPEGWEAFKSDHGGGVRLQAWVEANDAVITKQVTARGGMPQHHSTGALDECLAKVREFVEPRAFCYRNAERTNRMLGLVRLRLNKADDPRRYAAAIRTWLDANQRLPEQGAIRDTRGNYSLR